MPGKGLFHRVSMNTTDRKLWLTAAAAAVYVGAFFPITFLMKIDAAPLIILPVLLAGWFWGVRLGLLAGLLVIPVTMLLKFVTQQPDWNIFTNRQNVAGIIGTIISGVAAGYMGLLKEQARHELAERKRMDNDLQLLKAAVGSLPIGITIVDTDEKIVYMNDTEAAMHGYRVEELLGKDSRVLAPRESWNPIPFEQLYALRIWKRESVNINSKGEPFPVQLTSIAVKNAEGRAIGIITACEDVTERKRAEEALRASESSYRTLSENLPGIVYRVHLAGNNRMQIFNNMLKPMTGYTAEELTPGSIYSIDPLITPEDRKIVIKTVKQAVEMEEPFKVEYRLRHKNGEIRIFHERGRPVRGQDGSPAHIDGVILDISERKRAEEKLIQRQEALRAVYRMATTPGSSFKSVCDDVVANLSRLLGASILVLRREQGKSAIVSGFVKDDFLDHETNIPAPHYCTDVYIAKKTVIYKGPLSEICPDHPLAAAGLENLASIPVIGAAGDIYGAIDVSGWKDDFPDDAVRLTEIFARYVAFVIEQTIMEERLLNAQKLEVIGRLAGGVAHEVRNPLNAILAISDALAKDLGDNPEYEPFLAHIRIQVDRLSALMQDLLDLGKPVEQSQMQRISLADVCAVAVDIWKHSGQKRKYDVKVVKTEGIPVPVFADARKLHQVFMNLLDNAAQHSPEESEIRILIQDPKEGRCGIQVVDRGSGIAKEMLPRVFEPFFSMRKGGTGLGMSIVQHIVEAHGGTVTIANNAPPPGCTVDINLPLAEDEKS